MRKDSNPACPICQRSLRDTAPSHTVSNNGTVLVCAVSTKRSARA